MLDRQTLWTEVEFNEHRKDAQLAYSLDIALQNELTLEENIELLDRFVTEEMVPIGMIVDVAIHNPDRGKHGIPNPHGHLSAPMRPFLGSGEWGIKQHMEYVLDENGERIRKPNGKYKTIAVSETGWNDPALLEHWRERWAELVNQKFEEKGLTCRIDHRSNEARGITDAPQVHEGSAVRRMEAKGARTDNGTWNRWVSKTNDMIQRILSAIREISGWMKEMREEIKRLEDPTVSDMVMRYHSHMDEVANTYDHGVQNTKKTNMKQMNKACNYLMVNKITTPEELEALLEKKEKSLAGKDKDIESIKAEAGNATGTSSDGTQKPSRSGTSKSDDVKSTADASVTENDDDSEDKDADVSVDTGNDASNDDDFEESEDSSDDDSSEEEYEEDFSDEESDEEYGSRTAAFYYIGGMYEQIHERHGI